MGTEAPGPVGPHLSITVTTTMSAVWVVLTGELDATNVDILEATLSDVLQTEPTPVELVLAGLTFCDSRGADLLVEFVASARRRGQRVTNSGARASLQKLVRIASDGAIDFAS